MVERLKIAVEKARLQRAQATLAQGLEPLAQGSEQAAPASGVPAGPAPRAGAWNALEPIDLDGAHLERNRVISQAKTDPAHIAFDILRTRMLGALARHGWIRVGITSPNPGCGKTFVAANLALSLARQPDCHTVLIDMDMRHPSLARVLGVHQQDSLRWFVTGEVPAAKFLRRVGANLGLGLNSGRLQDAGEIILAPSTGHALTTMQSHLSPDVILYDLPPMLACDDVTGFLPQLDCVLMVVGGGHTKPSEIIECETLLKDNCPILGVLLNKAEGASMQHYGYY